MFIDRRTVEVGCRAASWSLALWVVGCDKADLRAGTTDAVGGTSAGTDAAAPSADAQSDTDGAAGSGCAPAYLTPRHGDASNIPDGAVLQRCPTKLPGPMMVNVPSPQGCTYCVDSTEVTNAQYAQFLTATNGGMEAHGQDPWCEWNMTYVPESSLPGDDYPVVSIDWCDAFAYCKWAGKHLCGRIGGGMNPYLVTMDRLKTSEWYNACSRDGTFLYPYGNNYDNLACNIGLLGGQDAQPDPVASKSTCEGGYSGLFDMSGNVDEWLNECDHQNGPNDTCAAAGGSTENYYKSVPVQVACYGGNEGIRKRLSSLTGFRCCGNSI